MNERDRLFETKYNHYKKMIFNICYAYTRNHSDAEDIFQDVFMRFYDLNKAFSSNEHEKNYLIRMTINYCKDFLRKKKRQRVVSDDNLIQLIPSKNDVEIEKANPLIMIEDLRDTYKDVIVLKYIENMSNQEISSVLNISEVNVRKRLERAIRKLKEKWEETNK